MIFDDMTKQEEDTIRKACVAHKYVTDDCIIKEKDGGTSLFILISGTAEARKDLSGEQYKKLKDLTKDDFFGDMSFLGVAPRTADVIATTDCEALELPLDKFKKLTNENPAIALKVYKNIAKELALRLQKNTNELRTAVMWAIQGMEM